METIVISMGGSVLLADTVETTFYTKLKQLLLSQENKKIYVVVGGGPPARNYISRARALHVSEDILDSIGIAVTRVNALFLASQLQKNIYTIPHSTKEAVQSNQPVVIMGGTTPGHSTDYVGAELAGLTKADLFVIATNVDGVYDKDPKAHDDAKLYSSISAQELINTYGSKWNAAGSNTVIDGPALQKIQTDHLKTVVINGCDITNLENVIHNKSFHGTKIIV